MTDAHRSGTGGTGAGGALPGAADPSGPRHGGHLAVEAAAASGVDVMWTLSGGHVLPLYDAAVHGDAPMRLVDVRHEQSAVFAAEATGKLTRRPGLAVLTAGPGVTNGVSAVTTARFNGSPLLVLGGRAPAARWGAGSLQELDHPPLLAPVTKRAATIGSTDRIAPEVDAGLRLAAAPHRGPVFLDVPMDVVFAPAGDRKAAADAAGDRRGAGAPRPAPPVPRPPVPRPLVPDPGDLAAVARLLDEAAAPVLVLGGDVWADGAEEAARRFAEQLRLPSVVNGMGRGLVPAGSELAVSRSRGAALKGADLVVVCGTPLDFRLGFGAFGGSEGAAAARVVHLADSPESLAQHVPLAGSAAGDLGLVLDGILELVRARPRHEQWVARLADVDRAGAERDAALLASEADPIHPVRVYGELRRVLDPDAVVICDGGDFVSYAGRYVESRTPGCWLDPGPYGCLGTGLGYAAAARIARPDSQVVVLLGDGAAGFSLMDVDTLVRHRLPVVLVVGNNAGWGLERHPMRAIYGYDVAADLQPECRYDEVVRALGGAGELVRRPRDIGPALRRAFAADVPYLVNVVTDPEVAYPRSTVLG
jgi:acetolactate synthase-1/2/3 large subunit